jgi:predicted ribosomally synthesized peptide with nif11-like leader
MSLESARLFVQEVYKNKDFANKVMKIEDNKELVDFANNTGYDFGADELKEVNQEFRKKENRELSETELSMVIGGFTQMFQPCIAGSTSAFCKQY